MDHASDPVGNLKPRAPSLRPLAMLGTLAVTAGLAAYLVWPARRSSASTRRRQALVARSLGHRNPGQALHVASAQDLSRSSTVHGMNFVELEAKAVRQWEAIEERRQALVAQTFSATDSRTA